MIYSFYDSDLIVIPSDGRLSSIDEFERLTQWFRPFD